MEILRLLEKFSCISSYEVLDYKTWDNGLYYKLKFFLKDESSLFVREYVSEEERIYSFHWQDKKKRLIFRWDNAPHYGELPMFPHHKHTDKDILPSKETTLKEVLEVINNKIL